MKSIFLLLFFVFHLTRTDDDDPCGDYIIKNSANSLGGPIDGKCMYVVTSISSATASSACRIGKGVVLLDRLSIASKAENDQVSAGLMNFNVQFAYIGLYFDGSTWSWGNGEPVTYINWKNPPPVVIPTTTQPVTVRSTLPPSEQRRATAVVIAVDASLFSTSAFTFAQVNFAQTLSSFIGDRGPAEFALFAYGCSQYTPWINQYPSFVSTFDATDQMIRSLNNTIVNNCVRTNPFDFATMFKNLEIVYYNRWSGSPRPFKSPYLSMILFGSSTDSQSIQSIPGLSVMSQSSVITVNVGTQSVDLSQLSVPYRQNYFRVTTTEDILNLVPKIDKIIFGTGSTASEMNMQESESLEDYAESIDATSYTSCAYMNSSDKYWYYDSCGKRANMCQFTITTEPPPTPNPEIAWADPCFYDETQFKYFKSLNNANCYRLSNDSKQFAEAEDECVSNHPLFLHTPKLTSVQSADEQFQLDTLLSEKPKEGMFWIGLRRDPYNHTNWYFINGDPLVYSNWREGYPRDADGCDCVAYVLNDNKWVNTDCNKNLYAICSYQFNRSSIGSVEARWRLPPIKN